MTIADDSTNGRRYRYYISKQRHWARIHGIKRLRGLTPYEYVARI